MYLHIQYTFNPKHLCTNFGFSLTLIILLVCLFHLSVYKQTRVMIYMYF